MIFGRANASELKRDNFAAFRKLNAIVYGISYDTRPTARS